MKIIKVGAMWCPSCIITNKYWKEIKSNYSDIEFIDLDIDFDSSEVEKYNVGDKLPVVIIFDGDKEVKRIIGEKKKEEMLKEIGDVL